MESGICKLQGSAFCDALAKENNSKHSFPSSSFLTSTSNPKLCQNIFSLASSANGVKESVQQGNKQDEQKAFTYCKRHLRIRDKMR